MMIVQTCILSLLCSAPACWAKIRHQGWLGRLVAYHKQHFIEDLSRLPLPITVRVEEAPANYVDEPGWDFQAVLRLVLLIEVLGAEPARQAVRFAMAPSRRHYLPFGVDTYKLFPSWSEFSLADESNNTMNLSSVSFPPNNFTDDTVVYIDNPLEARLPSKRITIKTLRKVMEQEAQERRNKATTTTTATTYSFTHPPSTPKGPPSSPPPAAGSTPKQEAPPSSAASAPAPEENTPEQKPEEGQKEGAADEGQKEGAADDGQKEGADDGGQKEEAADEGQQEGAADGGQKEEAADGGQKEEAADEGQQEGAADEGK